MHEAFIIALAYFVSGAVSLFSGFLALTRPIVLGPIVGMFCGDVKTGVVMGAELEAMYMGVSAIGAVTSIDTATATCVSIGLVIMEGIPLAEGIALASVIGTLTNSLGQIKKGINEACHPILIKILKKKQYKKFTIGMVLQSIIVNIGWTTMIIFLCMLLGSSVVQAVNDKIPAFILRGFEQAGKCLGAVGIGLTAQCIWQKDSFLFVLLGFICVKFLNMPILPTAILGFVIAALLFMNDLNIKNKTEALAVSAVSEGDDFYG